MKVIWEPAAKLELREYLAYCKKIFGLTTYYKLKSSVSEQLKRLSFFPQIGQKEFQLEDPVAEIRSLVINRYHLKIVYFIDESVNHIYIVDVWDTRREPCSLTKRVKDKF